MGILREFESSGNEVVGLRLVRSSSFGSKRVSMSNDMDVDSDSPTTSAKRQCFEDSFQFSDKSAIESLPQDVLIRILCGVDHDDLKQLFHVSKAIREATMVAKQWHFEYHTPRKSVGFYNAIEVDDSTEFIACKAQNAPKQTRVSKSRLTAKKLADISVALFTSAGEENWRRR